MHTRILLLLTLVVGFIPAMAQPHWQWGKTDPGISYSINPSYPRQVVAAANGKSLWGVIQNKKMTYGQVMLGDYKLTELSAMGVAGTSAMITGKVSLTDVKADAAGNWYILGYYYDSVSIGSGMSLVQSPPTSGSGYFMARLHAGTLAGDWIQAIGSNFYCATECFTIANGTIYLPIDSNAATAICSYTLSTGARTTLWQQTGRSYTSSIQADASGNVYLMGHCLLNGGINFNGTAAALPTGAQYPWYIARYRAGGQYDWHFYLTDITCTDRSIQLGGNNALYLTGGLADSTSLGGYHFSKPVGFFNADYLMARLDSNGTIVWAQQRPITSITQGGVYMDHQYHAAVADTNLYLFCGTSGTCIWGPGVSTTNVGQNATLIAYGASGMTLWAKTVNADFSIGQHIIADGSSLYVTGVGKDSTAMQFDTVVVPVSGFYVPYMAKMGLSAPVVVPTGVGAVSAVNGLKVWPNPAQGVVYVSGLGMGDVLQVLDITGRVVVRKVVGKAIEGIDVSGLGKGVYVVEALGVEGKRVGRVVVE